MAAGMRATGTSLLDAGRMALAGLLVAGCAGGPVVTTLPNDGTAGRVGIPYALPMTVLEVELSVRAPADTVSSKYVATLSLAARRVPDPRAKLLLLREDSAFHEDDVSVGLTDAGLLSSLNVTSSDQGGAVVQAAVRAVLQAIRATAAGTGAEKPPPSDLPEIEGVRRFVRALGHQTQVICLSESWRLVIECARADGGDSTPSSAPAAPDRAVEGVVVRSTEGWIVTASLVHAEGKTFRTDLTTALAVAAPDFCPWTVGRPSRTACSSGRGRSAPARRLPSRRPRTRSSRGSSRCRRSWSSSRST
jgi:hypothetical protein